MDDKALIAEAARMVSRAYAPYSGFRVGACVLTQSGQVYCGCNVENVSYGLTICAERAAMFAAVAAGQTRLAAVAVVSDGAKKPVPCGACLQVMSEFDVKRVIIGAKDKGFEVYELKNLLPEPFRP
jgi:cytidine deaminase